ncbi:ROK family transcriptional regulator [Caldanaerobacter subterraneus]|uniref:ROK family transcriptional regulator n=1 Tax=Caldanaerobacter subterraneus TaxID=911092 RepID=A0A7Y2PKD4_9THEO|nr:ROK family transcriptional regulator [Caldanaerobacter subterraneus]MBE3578678.1 ROK family transcriptional regulator [Caldanaerobacter subterraneus]NNG66834.1 ROK family transcriptional regulator [Caldanaerobacter subterraneus]
MITADQLLVKQINKSIVLNTIRKKGNISRAEIASITGLNKSTVSFLVDELINEGFVKEEGPGESRGGRKPIILNINEKAGCIIGIDLDVNYILIVLTDLMANVIWEKKMDIEIGESQQTIIERLIELIDEAISNAPETVKGILGIGIGVPGIVDYKKGIILLAPNLKWENVPLKQIIEDRFKIKVKIDNEANVGAIGEKWFGEGSKYNNFVYVSAGIGVGTGIIINGELYRGTMGLAGEMGHMTIDIHDHQCRCGNTGCWENYASEKALFEYIENQLINDAKDGYINKENFDSLTTLKVIDYAQRGSLIAKKALKEVGKNLGVGVVNIINTFNPELVIIGNTLSLAKELILDEILKEVETKSLVYRYSKTKITTSKLELQAGAIGAVSLVISELFAYPDI